jgi:hypothetical protein
MNLFRVFFLVSILLIVGCQPSESSSPMKIAETQIPPTVTATVVPTKIPTLIGTPTVTLTPTVSPTATPDTRLTARYWRELPVVPEFSAHAEKILRHVVKDSKLDVHTFSKVGDCQMTAGTFLAGYANGKYKIPDGYQTTVEWLSESMLSESVTAERGLGISSVLNPMFGLAAGYSQCLRNETPLDCELRTRRPAVVLIGMGTNWIPNAELSFEKYLRQIVDKVLETGALPILATKADNIEGDWRLNQAIAKVAYDYDLPLVNVWRSVRDLPGRGLERKIYLTPDGWMRRNHAWLLTLDHVREVLTESPSDG